MGWFLILTTLAGLMDQLWIRSVNKMWSQRVFSCAGLCLRGVSQVVGRFWHECCWLRCWGPLSYLGTGVSVKGPLYRAQVVSSDVSSAVEEAVYVSCNRVVGPRRHSPG